jgi:IS1 family transposase|tara:strand:+ start:378 stop:1217 length:840 start_codon:yes stop_codon:yes gene_type:complete
MRIDDKDLYEMVYLFFTGYPISEMVGLKGYSESTIRDNLLKCIEHFGKFEQFRINYDEYVPEVVEVDEIYLRIQGHREFYGWVAYDPVNKFVIDVEVGKRNEETLEKLFKRLSTYRGKVKLAMVDGYRNYKKLIKKYLARNGHMPTTGVINKSKYVPKLEGFLTYAYFGKSRKDAEQLVKHYGIGHKISTAMIENLNQKIRDSLAYMRRRSARMPRLLEWGERALRGLRIFRNYTQPSLPLSFKSSKNWIKWPITPAMEVGLTEKPLTIEEILCHPTLN